MTTAGNQLTTKLNKSAYILYLEDITENSEQCKSKLQRILTGLQVLKEKLSLGLDRFINNNYC